MKRVKDFFKVKENLYHKEGPTGLDNSENERLLSLNLKDFTLRKGIILITVVALGVIAVMNTKANMNKEKEKYNDAVLVGQLSVERQNLASGINPPNLSDMAQRVKENNFSDNAVKDSLNPNNLGQKDRIERVINSATQAFNKSLNEKGIELPKTLDESKLKNDGVNFENDRPLRDQSEEQRLEALRKRLGMMKR